MKFLFGRFALLFLLSFVLQSSQIGAQKSAEPGATVFHAETRQVVVDVVVADHIGHFVSGLTPTDFTVLEDGKAQKISAFAMHAKPAVTAKPAPRIKTSPNLYTNYAIADPERPITIVLMDLLNTQVQDQAYTRKQMIEFLKSLPAGERVALFALGTRLRMIQGFTGESGTLVAAAKMLLRDTSPLLTTEQHRQDDEIIASNLQANAGPGSMGPPAGTPGGGGFGASADTFLIAPVANGIQNALISEQNSQQTDRMELTLAALQSLARAVSAYPGRKNLLWLSAEFPISFSPNFAPTATISEQAQSGLNRSNRMQALRVNAPPIRETAALLATSQIAVYPIDIRGTIAGAGIDLSGATVYGSGQRLSDMRDRASERQITMEWDDHEAMTNIARETGGKAFYGSNDIKAALSASMEEGESYYTIAYTPENHKWDSKYRKIEIKCAQNVNKLTYRRGYYAVPDTALAVNGKVADDQVAMLFATAMHPEAPTSTMLLLKVQVLPPDAEHKAVRIDYAINPRDVTFTDNSDDTKHVMLDLMAVVWGKDGKAVAEDSSKIDTSVSLKVYQGVMNSYVPAHQELAVKPGIYTLRVGVVDRNTRKIGTLDVPLTIPERQISDNAR